MRRGRSRDDRRRHHRQPPRDGKEGKWAIIGESSLQEECVHAPCVVYAVDTTSATFERRLLIELPARYDILEAQHCADKTPAQCSQELSRMLLEEDSAAHRAGTSEQSLLLQRYLDSLSVWQRAQIGAVSPPPDWRELDSEHYYDPAGPMLVLSEVHAPPSIQATKDTAPRLLTLRLKERWTAPSFRSTTEEGRHCYPPDVPSCQQVERWEDGTRRKAWTCTAPQSAESEENVTLDCAGRASLVRVEASWSQGATAEGRSSWVEPGALAQDAMSQVSRRSVDLSTLGISRHGIRVYTLPHATLVVGGFAHGLFANGSWFPFVVAAPHTR